MRRFLRNSLQFLLFLAIALLLLWVAFRDMPAESLLEGFRASNGLLISLAICVAFFSYLFRAFRWQLLIRPLGHTPKVSHLFYSVMVGYLANFLFPRLGEVARCGVLSRKSAIPVDKLIGTVIVERVVDMASLLLITLIYATVRFEFLLGFFEKTGDYFDMPGNNFLVALLFGVLLMALGGWVMYRLLKKYFPKGTFRDRISKWMQGVTLGLRSLMDLRQRGAFLLFTLLIWMAYFGMTYLLFLAIPATSHLTPADTFFILVIGSFAFVIPAQGGIGSFHLMISLGLTILGVSRADGLVYATLSHSVQSLFAVLLGALSFALLFSGLRSQPSLQSQ